MRVKIDSSKFETQIRALARAGSELVALEILNRLESIGVERAKMLAQSSSGEMRAMIHPDPPQYINGEAVGGWRASSDHSVFVEYGTGAPGAAGQVKNGQPRDPRAAGFTYTLQSVKNMRINGALVPKVVRGWTYYDPVRQRFIHTLGQPAQPFMYPAKLHVEQQAGKVAADVLRDMMKRSGR